MTRDDLPSYRLRGDVAGIERTYPVKTGETRIGSLGSNDVVLPVRGVSRGHALLRLSDEGLSIEDLGSRNGVLVNGVRTMTARLRTGDELRLGPVALRVEEVALADATLAITLSGAAAPVGLPAAEATATWAGQGDGLSTLWLRIVEGLVERLTVVPEVDVAGALAFLIRELPAQGCCFFDSSGGEVVILASAGLVGDAAALEDANDSTPFRTTRGGEAGATTWTVLPSTGVGLAVWGDYPNRGSSELFLRTLARLWRALRPEPARLLQSRVEVKPPGLVFPEGYVVGRSPAMTSVYGQMKPLVQGDLPVVITGETGVGKELIARILHESSPRAGGPFVAVNCAAIPADLLEAEMFGIGKSVATGVAERPGKFRLAHGGTLFLDEIGDMSQDLQAKLLRALQEKEIQPVGSPPVPVDIRVVTATNSDLLGRIEAGRFRQDLYYRVAGYVLQLPPLRARLEDLPALVESFLRTVSQQAGKHVQGMTLKALRGLASYRWPGNVRELEHEVRRLVYLCPEGGAIDSALLSPHIISPKPSHKEPESPEHPSPSGYYLSAHVQDLESRLIHQALAQTGGNRTEAARLLGISRNGLAIKMQRLGIVD
jgi:DNA-binding NtrC family response regulator